MRRRRRRCRRRRQGFAPGAPHAAPEASVGGEGEERARGGDALRGPVQLRGWVPSGPFLEAHASLRRAPHAPQGLLLLPFLALLALLAPRASVRCREGHRLRHLAIELGRGGSRGGAPRLRHVRPRDAGPRRVPAGLDSEEQPRVERDGAGFDRLGINLGRHDDASRPLSDARGDESGSPGGVRVSTSCWRCWLRFAAFPSHDRFRRRDAEDDSPVPAGCPALVDVALAAPTYRVRSHRISPVLG